MSFLNLSGYINAEYDLSSVYANSTEMEAIGRLGLSGYLEQTIGLGIALGVAERNAEQEQ